MLRCLDPTATWTHELAGQTSEPPERRVRIRARYLSAAALLRYRELRLRSTQEHSDGQAMRLLLDALRMIVAAVEIPEGTHAAAASPAPCPGAHTQDAAPPAAIGSAMGTGGGAGIGGDAVEQLAELLTASELFDLSIELQVRQRLAELDLGKSESPSPGRGGESARAAAVPEARGA